MAVLALCWWRFPLVVMSRASLQLQCVGFSFQWLPLSRALALGCVGSVVEAPGPQSTDPVVVVHGLSCSVVCGTLLDQGSKPCLLHWHMGSLPVSHQESPFCIFLLIFLLPQESDQGNIGIIYVRECLPLICSSSFMVTRLTIKSLSHFEFIFVHVGRVCSHVIDLQSCVSVLVSQSPLHLSTPVRLDQVQYN